MLDLDAGIKGTVGLHYTGVKDLPIVLFKKSFKNSFSNETISLVTETNDQVNSHNRRCPCHGLDDVCSSAGGFHHHRTSPTGRASPAGRALPAHSASYLTRMSPLVQYSFSGRRRGARPGVLRRSRVEQGVAAAAAVVPRWSLSYSRGASLRRQK